MTPTPDLKLIADILNKVCACMYSHYPAETVAEQARLLLAADEDDARRVGTGVVAGMCSDCPPAGYPTDKTRCTPCPRRADESDGWLPIESAPKDGTEVWAFNGEQGRMRWISGDGYALWAWADSLLCDVDPNPEQPSHYRTLPHNPGKREHEFIGDPNSAGHLHWCGHCGGLDGVDNDEPCIPSTGAKYDKKQTTTNPGGRR